VNNDMMRVKARSSFIFHPKRAEHLTIFFYRWVGEAVRILHGYPEKGAWWWVFRDNMDRIFPNLPREVFHTVCKMAAKWGWLDIKDDADGNTTVKSNCKLTKKGKGKVRIRRKSCWAHERFTVCANCRKYTEEVYEACQYSFEVDWAILQNHIRDSDYNTSGLMKIAANMIKPYSSGMMFAPRGVGKTQVSKEMELYRKATSNIVSDWRKSYPMLNPDVLSTNSVYADNTEGKIRHRIVEILYNKAKGRRDMNLTFTDEDYEEVKELFPIGTPIYVRERIVIEALAEFAKQWQTKMPALSVSIFGGRREDGKFAVG